MVADAFFKFQYSGGLNNNNLNDGLLEVCYSDHSLIRCPVCCVFRSAKACLCMHSFAWSKTIKKLQNNKQNNTELV